VPPASSLPCAVACSSPPAGMAPQRSEGLQPPPTSVHEVGCSRGGGGAVIHEVCGAQDEQRREGRGDNENHPGR
jgi:hypothetical protein